MALVVVGFGVAGLSGALAKDSDGWDDDFSMPSGGSGWDDVFGGSGGSGGSGWDDDSDWVFAGAGGSGGSGGSGWDD